MQRTTTAGSSPAVRSTPDAAAPSGRQGASTLARLTGAVHRYEHRAVRSADVDAARARAVAAARKARRAMGDRHVPRLCNSPRAPMAVQENACWSCAVVWSDDVRPARRRTADWRSTTESAVMRTPAIVFVADVRLGADEDHWGDEGGSRRREGTGSSRATRTSPGRGTVGMAGGLEVTTP